MKQDLVDEFGLIIYPVTIGSGKCLFPEGTIPAAYRAIESIFGGSRVTYVTYECPGVIILVEAQPSEVG